MKKKLTGILLPIIVALCGIGGAGLRLWTLSGGPSATGLYPSRPFVWCFLLVLTLATLAVIIALILKLQQNKYYQHNFTASLPGAIGFALAALAFLLSAFRVGDENRDTLGILGLLFGLGGAVCFSLGAVDRYFGRKPRFWVLLVPCLFLGLRLFLCCRGWSTVSQTGNYLLPFAAGVFLPLAVWHLDAFTLDIGNRHYSLFFSLAALYFCITALPGGDDPVFYGCMAAFLATNLCRTASPATDPCTDQIQNNEETESA